MDRETSERDRDLDLLEQDLRDLETRLNDTKGFLNTFATLLSVIFGTFVIATTVIGYFQFNRELGRIEKLEQDIQTKLGLLEDTSQLVIRSISGQAVETENLPAFILYDQRRPRVSLGFRMHNAGASYADVTQIKIYTNAPLTIQRPRAAILRASSTNRRSR